MCGVCGCSSHDGHAQNAQYHEHQHKHSTIELHAVELDILAKNNAYAAENRRRFEKNGIVAFNFLSSPGAGKTTLLVKTLAALKARLSVAVIEGDQETSIDAHRIKAVGIPAVQINTGRGCHLDAHMVGHALDEIPLEPGGMLFIENVGNLVCPATFDLGEHQKIAILSVTEGDDKPLKYPDTFAAASTLIVSKSDLLPHVDFDVDRCIENARSINPDIGVFTLSSRSGEGMETWLGWLENYARRTSANTEIATHA
ncbi:hydrogenase nickel incorporation protein HypB [Hyphomicrobium sp.]|jgi:hydrogenase nickel incorporation protein HypB|uniref:hydrogenase nickel incorporation protein HypB n=1 Tax=Hyphomicrobium sp. TaxID=82 RepID=UPI002C4D0080|nr:hydrogenase nickel incorporation protein HypB [Hyphomicrobium sp.]HVZ03921.1 hydrogenase nickel incorporation protein HypB [Hyphomicrobium sp.]